MCCAVSLVGYCLMHLIVVFVLCGYLVCLYLIVCFMGYCCIYLVRLFCLVWFKLRDCFGICNLGGLVTWFCWFVVWGCCLFSCCLFVWV